MGVMGFCRVAAHKTGAAVPVFVAESERGGLYPEIPEGHRTVVTLQHDGSEGFFIREGCGVGGAGDLDMGVDGDTVVDDLEKAGVLRFLSGGVEARGAEKDVIGLPFAGGLAQIHEWRVPFDLPFFFLVPAGINAATVGVVKILHAETVEDLHLIAAHEVDAGIRSARNAELQMHLDISVLWRAEKIARAGGGAIQ